MGVLPIGGWGGGGGASLPAGTSGYIMRYIGGSWVARELSASGLAAARPAAAAGREGQFYWATDATAGLELSECVHQGGSTYAWTIVPYGATATGVALVQAASAAGARTAIGVYSAAEVDAAVAGAGGFPTPLLVTSANATVTDASPAGDGSAAIDSSGIITLTTDPALPGSFAAGPKVSLPFTLDAGSRFRARVRLVSKAGPSSNSVLALYFKGVAGLAIFARISGQIGVWDLGVAVPATAPVSALWDGSEYLEIRMVDGYLHFGVWQGTTYTTVYLTTTTVRPTTVGVMLGRDGGAATQTVVTDSFEITDLRAW